MQGFELTRFGGPEVMQLAELPEPEPDAHRPVRVRLAWAGVNYVDTYQREGRYPGAALPWRLGLEAAGVVDAALPGSGFDVGDRVAMVAPVQGCYAEAITVAPSLLVPVPDALPLETAAAVLEHGLTAQMIVETVGRVQAGERVLVHAAAGGVGALALQWARALGAEVWGTVSSEEKAAAVAALGGIPLRYGPGSHTPWPDALRRACRSLAAVGTIEPEVGVDLVLDGVAADTLEGSLRVLRRGGRLVLYGSASGAVPTLSVPALMSHSLTVTRPVLPHYLGGPGVLQAKAAALFARVLRGELQVHVHDRLPLAEAAAAHTLLQSRATRGKLLLRISGAA
ncbi:MAG TPA: zinc-binding dehydrogenase [Ideonella sp.]|uniref:zinc-binding dehydrogenase n=1 Tax=Ideonella sp. TaxID=1929293 RepID=UPI002CA7EBF9|nr:zinc-binding dehydrogenase [Ideonella sp.]HSI50371.1 zinc-binding dehydrogenase [Ideonella sp.]